MAKQQLFSILTFNIAPLGARNEQVKKTHFYGYK